MLDPVVGAASDQPRRPRGTRLAAIVLAAVALAACQAGPYADDSVKLHQQAQAALDRWADAVDAAGGQSAVVLVGEPTGQVGDWEEAVGDNNKRALMAGLVESEATPPTEAPPDAEVQWPNGTAVTVPVLSAAQAVAAIQAEAPGGPCGDCVPLWITAAQLTSGSIGTSRGPATGPVWEFTIRGTAVKVTRVALAHPITVVPPPWDPNDPPVGVAIDSASGTIDGLELTVNFVGSPRPGDQPCGEDYTAEAVESDLAAVVIVTRHPHLTLGGCTAEGAARTATATLARPLGDRAVLEIQQGLPVPVVVTP